MVDYGGNFNVLFILEKIPIYQKLFYNILDLLNLITLFLMLKLILMLKINYSIFILFIKEKFMGFVLLFFILKIYYFKINS